MKVMTNKKKQLVFTVAVYFDISFLITDYQALRSDEKIFFLRKIKYVCIHFSWRENICSQWTQRTIIMFMSSTNIYYL